MARLPAIRQFMDTEVPTLAPDTPILDAIDFLIEHSVTGAPVVDSRGMVIGMVTEKDCLRVLALGTDNQRSKGPVSDYMTAPVETVPPGMNIYFAAGIFLAHAFRRLPVVEDGKLVGAITRFDILRAVSKDHKLVVE